MCCFSEKELQKQEAIEQNGDSGGAEEEKKKGIN